MGFSLKNGDGNQSATKWGTLLIGLSFIFATLGGVFQGDMTWATAVNQLIVEVGGILGVIGIRDLPFFN